MKIVCLSVAASSLNNNLQYLCRAVRLVPNLLSVFHPLICPGCPMTEASQGQVPLPPSCLKTWQYVIAGEDFHSVLEPVTIKAMSKRQLSFLTPREYQRAWIVCASFFLRFTYLFACLLQKQFVFIIEDWEDTKSMRNERKIVHFLSRTWLLATFGGTDSLKCLFEKGHT